MDAERDLLTANNTAEFQAMVSAAWAHVLKTDGYCPRPKVHRTKLHDDHMIVGVAIGSRRLTIAMPLSRIPGLLN